ncbi:MAG: methyltransferase family protein [Promethearchaeota archaeon]
MGFNAVVANMWFYIFLIGFVLAVPIHFLSVEHNRLETKYGSERGKRIGEVLGMISGWGFFGFWIGMWLAPQPRFTLPLLQEVLLVIPVFETAAFTIPLVHLVLSIGFALPGAWLGIEGVRKTGLKAAETHRTDKIVTNGVYSLVRHPQYLGGVLSHAGIVLFLSAWYALLSTPLVLLLNFLISWKEEIELAREFGEEYSSYQKATPMLLPRLTRPRNDGESAQV